MSVQRETHVSYRHLSLEVIESGQLRRILGIIDGFVPDIPFDRVRRISGALLTEARGYGFELPFPLVRDLVFMQELMLPRPQDEEFSLAMSRLFAFNAYYDDLCSRDRRRSPGILRSILGGVPESSPYAAYSAYIFQELAPFCAASTLGVLRAMATRSALGVLLETEYSRDGDDTADTEFIRDLAGFNELWCALLQFAHPSLSLSGDLRYWAATFRTMNHFISDINDVCSFHKEILDGDDFLLSRICRESRKSGRPYLEVYGETVDRALRSHTLVQQAATPEQRPYVRRFQRGYVYWHTHTERYRWDELVPGTVLLDVPRI